MPNINNDNLCYASSNYSYGTYGTISDNFDFSE